MSEDGWCTNCRSHRTLPGRDECPVCAPKPADLQQRMDDALDVAQRTNHHARHGVTERPSTDAAVFVSSSPTMDAVRERLRRWHALTPDERRTLTYAEWCADTEQERPDNGS